MSDFGSLLAGFQAAGSEYKQSLIQKGRMHRLYVQLKQPAAGSWIMMDVTHGSNAQKPSHMFPRGQVGV